MPDYEAIEVPYFKNDIESNKTVYIIFRGEGVMNIHKHQNAHLPFFPPKKCKRHPIYSINVYKCTTVQTK